MLWASFMFYFVGKQFSISTIQSNRKGPILVVTILEINGNIWTNKPMLFLVEGLTKAYTILAKLYLHLYDE